MHGNHMIHPVYAFCLHVSLNTIPHSAHGCSTMPELYAQLACINLPRMLSNCSVSFQDVILRAQWWVHIVMRLIGDLMHPFPVCSSLLMNDHCFHGCDNLSQPLYGVCVLAFQLTRCFTYFSLGIYDRKCAAILVVVLSHYSYYILCVNEIKHGGCSIIYCVPFDIYFITTYTMNII